VTETSFQRARKPEQISARREAILAAAAELFDEAGPEGAGLNAISARADFTKSNVYRYFESREAVLLSLFIEGFAELAEGLEKALASVPPNDLGVVAKVSAAAFLARPRLCQLMSILSNVLERNVSEEAVLDLKRQTFALAGRISLALSQALPAIPPEDCAWGANVIGTYVAGLWPGAHPSQNVCNVLARPEFAALKPNAERDLERMIVTLLRGLGK
jgi:TetR/AcrR family transcriptional regulator